MTAVRAPWLLRLLFALPLLLTVLTLPLGGCANRLRIAKATHGAAHTASLTHPGNDVRRWYIPLATPDGETWLFFVDTGYSYTTCDDDFVAALGVTVRGSTSVRGELGRIETGRASLPRLMLGGHQIDKLRCQVRDLNTTSSLQDPREVRIGGVIGMDLLTPFRVVFDPALGTMTLHDPRKLPKIRRSDEGFTRLRREARTGPRVLVPLRVADRTTWPVLDTGATSTHLDTDRLGLAPTRVREGVEVRGSGPGARQVRDMRYVETGPVLLGPHVIDQATFIARPTGAWQAAGLVGLDLLRYFHQDYDFRARRAVLRPAIPEALTSWPARQRDAADGPEGTFDPASATSRP